MNRIAHQFYYEMLMTYTSLLFGFNFFCGQLILVRYCDENAFLFISSAAVVRIYFMAELLNSVS